MDPLIPMVQVLQLLYVILHRQLQRLLLPEHGKLPTSLLTSPILIMQEEAV